MNSSSLKHFMSKRDFKSLNQRAQAGIRQISKKNYREVHDKNLMHLVFTDLKKKGIFR